MNRCDPFIPQERRPFHSVCGSSHSPRNSRTCRRKSPTCHSHHGDGTWGPASRAAQAGSRGPSGPAFVLSACPLPEVNHAFFTFAEGDRLVAFCCWVAAEGRSHGAAMGSREAKAEDLHRRCNTSAIWGSDHAKLREEPRSEAMCRPTLRGGVFRRGAAVYIRWLKYCQKVTAQPDECGSQACMGRPILATGASPWLLASA
jgi:hypothetical protein